MLSLKFGWIGVNIFFVLSGFLITRILLNEKQNRFKDYISSFYYKRVLRIFPLYYAYLGCAFALILLFTFLYPWLVNQEDWKSGYYAARHDFIYYLTYTYNIKINLRYFTHLPDSSGRFFGHLWSLSLEEQFYILFPLLVYFASLKTLKRIAIAVIIICPLLRLWGVLYGMPRVTDSYWFGELFYSNTLLQADALFTGAALAIFDIKQVKPYLTFFITGAAWLATGMICFYFLRKSGFFLVAGKSLGYDFPGLWFGEKTPYWFINIRPFYQYTLVNLLAAALVLPAINGKPLFPKIFVNKQANYLGKISYGIYIFHNPLLAVFMILADVHWGGWNKLTANPLAEVACFIIYVGVVIGVAHLSYQYFEKRILKYKYVLKPAPVSA